MSGPSGWFSVDTLLYNYKTLKHSTNGNPRFKFWTGHGRYITQTDCAFSYEVENLMKQIPMYTGRMVRLYVTRNGRVFGMDLL